MLTNYAQHDAKRLVVYLTAGYPDEATFVEAARVCLAAGVDAIEVGVPFSDPSADGPTIQLASAKAIESGVTSLERVAQLTERINGLPGADQLDLIWMGYLNPFLQYGLEQSIALGANAGVQGWIVPDLPLEEAVPFVEAIDRSGTDAAWIPLLASTTRADRAQKMLQMARSFAYYVSIKGVTGARTQYPPDWHLPLDAIRGNTDRPILVGFGVSTPELAAECAEHSDGVIIGSKVLDTVVEHDGMHKLERFLAAVRKAIDA